MLKSLRFRILLIIFGIILMITATFMFFARNEIESAMTRSEQESAKNALKLVMLNIENEYNGLQFHRKATTEKYERQLKYLDEIVITYIDELYSKVQKGTLSEQAAKQLAIEGVSRFRYGEDNYFFIMDKKGMTVSHPDPSMKNVDISKLVDINGKNIGLSFIDIALKNGEGYTSYWWKKLKDDTPQQKLVYVKFYPQWNWIIGTGVYIDEIEEEIQERKNIIIEGLRNTLSKIKIAKTGYLFVNDGKSQIIFHPNLIGDASTLKNPVTKKSITEELKEASKHPDIPFEYPWDKPSDKGNYKYWKQSYVAYFEPFDWYVCSSVYIDEMKAPGKELSQKILYISLTFFAIGVALSLLFARTLTVPITNLVKTMKQIKAQGLTNLKAPVSGTTETRELGTIFNSMLESINNAIKTKEQYEKNAREDAKLVAIGKTASMLAHDVRKPFSSMKSMLNMLEHYINNPSALNAARSDIDKSIQDVDAMIADIMDLSREANLHVKPCSLSSIIRALISEIAPAYSRLNISFEYSLGSKHKPLVDEKRVARVFQNILTNALEAISILGKRTQGSILFSSRDVQLDRQNFVEITIANDGPPLIEEDIPNLFGSFFTKGKKDGTGLGLASAQKMIELHDGTITAKNSDDKKKVEFTIRIPASDEVENTDLSPLPVDLKSTLSHSNIVSDSKIDQSLAWLTSLNKKFKMVLLEDEILYRASLRNLVNSNQRLRNLLTIYEAQRVDDALALLTKENITHAIVDIDLKETKDGYDFLKEVKQRNLDVACLVHSNRKVEQYVKKAMELGAQDYVSKPIHIEDLVKFLEVSERSRLPKGRSIVLFIVDDDSIARTYIEDISSKALRSKNPNIYTFKDPESALKSISDLKPNIIISDFFFDKTSSMRGDDFIKEIKTVDKNILTFLMSNMPLSKLKEAADAVGANGYFSPTILEEELSVIFSALYGE